MLDKVFAPVTVTQTEEERRDIEEIARRMVAGIQEDVRATREERAEREAEMKAKWAKRAGAAGMAAGAGAAMSGTAAAAGPVVAAPAAATGVYMMGGKTILSAAWFLAPFFALGAFLYKLKDIPAYLAQIANGEKLKLPAAKGGGGGGHGGGGHGGGGHGGGGHH